MLPPFPLPIINLLLDFLIDVFLEVSLLDDLLVKFSFLLFNFLLVFKINNSSLNLYCNSSILLILLFIKVSTSFIICKILFISSFLSSNFRNLKMAVNTPI